MRYTAGSRILERRIREVGGIVQREYRDKSYNVYSFGLGIPFIVSVQFYVMPYNDVSIESYELDGDNISREELENIFGSECVDDIEARLLEE